MKFDINFGKKTETSVFKKVYYIYYSIFVPFKTNQIQRYICKFQFDSIFFLER